MAVNLSPVFGVAGQVFNDNGDPLAGGKIFTYSAGTTTPVTSFTTSTGSTAHSNPIQLDGAGRVPSGEIWLTNGIQYKFVIEDSANNLIGTYDNIIGINSSSINYTNEQEIQVATAGQTVFNLTTMQYAPGTNSLSVFVDGINQYGPGAQYNYLETDSDTVTFTSGLSNGAEVKFTTSQLTGSAGGAASGVSFTGFNNQAGTVQDLAGNDGSDWIGFEADGNNAIARSAQDKMRDIVSVKDFGAVGDGVTNDTLAVQAAIDVALTVNGQVFFPPGKYRCDSAITVTMPNSAGWATTSTTSVAIGLGTKTFTVAAGLAIIAGNTVTANAGTLGQGYMSGTVTSYGGTSLQINVTSISGSGTYAGWDIVQNFRNTNAIASLTIFGSGQDNTIVYFPASDGFNFVLSSQQHTVHVKDVSITTGQLAASKAVIFTNSYPYFGTFVAQSDFTNVTFRGDTGYSQGTSVWFTCVEIANVSDINFNNVNFLGSGIPSGNGLVISSPGAGSFDAPTTTATNFNLVNCNFTFLGQGINYGENTQTLQIANSFFAQNTTDIYVPPNSGTLQGLTIDGCTFFKGAPGDCIYITSPLPNLIITNNFITSHSGFRGIAMDEGNNTTIVGNQFLPADVPNGATAAIQINKTDVGSLTIIDGNTFSSTTIGCLLNDDATGVYVGPGNTCTSNMTLVTESSNATGNTIYFGLRSKTKTAAIGYATGAGAAVTQLTNKTTGVTINSATGQITTANSLLNNGSTAVFQVTNSVVESTDIVLVATPSGNYTARTYNYGAGVFDIALTNVSGGALSDAVLITFAVIKCVAS